jgi:hypothetical protein
MPNLTKKFSRDSLQRATTHRAVDLSAAKVHSIKEEIARASAKNQRLSTDALIRASRSYKERIGLTATMSTLTENTEMKYFQQNSISNTQILTAMSSMTEDQFANAVIHATPPKPGPLPRVIGPSCSFDANNESPPTSNTQNEPRDLFPICKFRNQRLLHAKTSTSKPH